MISFSNTLKAINEIQSNLATKNELQTNGVDKKSVREKNYFCESCAIVLNSKKVYDQHLEGQKHKKKVQQLDAVTNLPIKNENNENKNEVGNNSDNLQVKQKKDKKTPIAPKTQDEFKCEICNISAFGKLCFEQHMMGKSHLKKLKSVELQPASNQPGDVQFKCDLCNLKLASNEQLQCHLVGKKHLKKTSKNHQEKISDNSDMNPKKELQEFNCEICKIKLINIQQLGAHLAGKKHLKKVNQPPSTSNEFKSNSKTIEEEKYEKLNIAWDKYKIDESSNPPSEGKFEYFCAMCNKYMQKKPQLVDHLKSRKHHRKIYEKRKGELNPNENGQNDLIKPARVNNGRFPKIKKTKINFVSASSGTFSSVNMNNNTNIDTTNNSNNNYNNNFNNGANNNYSSYTNSSFGQIATDGSQMFPIYSNNNQPAYNQQKNFSNMNFKNMKRKNTDNLNYAANSKSLKTENQSSNSFSFGFNMENNNANFNRPNYDLFNNQPNYF